MASIFWNHNGIFLEHAHGFKMASVNANQALIHKDQDMKISGPMNWTSVSNGNRRKEVSEVSGLLVNRKVDDLD